MNYYYGRSVYRIPSTLEPERDFPDADAARGHDRELAIALISSTPPDELRLALNRGGRRDLKEALAYLAEEIDETQPPMAERG
jgi:hypothetical protein